MKLGQIIASRPISKLRYIAGKAISNLGVLIVMELIFIAALTVMQFVRGESYAFDIWGYLNPLLQVTLPYMIFLAALTVLFDVVPFLQGVFGNIMYFVFWLIILPVSIELPKIKFLDLFGFNRIMGSMMNAASEHFPSIDKVSYGFGYNKISAQQPVFEWNGLTFDSAFLLSRICWIGIAVLVIILSAALFNRFKETERPESNRTRRRNLQKQVAETRYIETVFCFSPVRKSKLSNILRLLTGEIRNMISGYPLWWYLVLVAGIGLSAFMPVNKYYFFYTLALLTLIPVWSNMGNKDKYFGMQELVSYRCSAKLRWLTSLLAGLIISIIGSAGFIINLAVIGDTEHFIAFLIGLLFINSFALVLGILTKSRIPFEAIFIIWFYMGPIQNIPALDFFGLQSPWTVLYGVMSLALMVIGYFLSALKDKHVLNYI